MCPGNHVIDRVAICCVAQTPQAISCHRQALKGAAPATAATAADLGKALHALEALGDDAAHKQLLCGDEQLMTAVSSQPVRL